MGLNLGGGLFPRTGLEQDTGLLRERWGQDGSALVTIAKVSGTDETLYTVTAGKTLYISSILYVGQATAPTSASLKDGGSGGTLKFRADASIEDHPFSNQLLTPIPFTTDIYMTGSDPFNWNIQGWEE